MTSILGIYASSMRGAVGDFESIATVTVGSGGASSVTFSSIPSTYQHLQVRLFGRGTNSDANIDGFCWLNGNETQSNYTNHFLRGNGSTASAGGSQASATPTMFSINSGGSGSGMFGVAVIDILDYANTNKNKTMRSLTGEDENGGGNIYFRSALFMNTSAVGSIKLIGQAGNNFAQYTSAALYGIKG